jgi:hypothetical protein
MFLRNGSTYKATRRNITEDGTLHSHRRETFVSYIQNYPSESRWCKLRSDGLYVIELSRLLLYRYTSQLTRFEALVWMYDCLCSIRIILTSFRTNKICDSAFCSCRRVAGWATKLQAGKSRVRFAIKSLDFAFDRIHLAAESWAWLNL